MHRVTKLVFLDRDGVVNRRPANDGFVRSWGEFQFLPGVAEAIRLLNRHAMFVIIVTNQRGVSLGLYSESDLQKLHQRMQADLNNRGAKLDGIYYCPHGIGECECRKPAIGMFEQALRELPSIEPDAMVVVGNSITDMKAADRLGCRKVLVGDECDPIVAHLAGDGIHVEFVCESLLEGVQKYILAGSVKSASGS